MKTSELVATLEENLKYEVDLQLRLTTSCSKQKKFECLQFLGGKKSKKEISFFTGGKYSDQ